MQSDTNLKNMYILSDLSYTDMEDYQVFEEILLPNIYKKTHINLTKIEKIQEYLKYKNSPNKITIENKTQVLMNEKLIITYKNSRGQIKLDNAIDISTKSKEDKDIIAIQYGVKSMKQSLTEYDNLEYLENNKLVNFTSPNVQLGQMETNIQALTFINKNTKEMDIGFRGTETKSDMLTDLKMGIGLIKPKYFDEAEKFVINSYKTSPGIKQINYYGHSLGGTMANYVNQVMTQKFKKIDPNIIQKSRTINAYNVIRTMRNLLEEIEGDAINYVHTDTYGMSEVLSDLGEAETGSIHINKYLKTVNEGMGYFEGHTLEEVGYTIKMYEEFFEVIGERNIEQANKIMEEISVPFLPLLITLKQQGITFDNIEDLDLDKFDEIKELDFKDNLNNLLDVNKINIKKFEKTKKELNDLKKLGIWSVSFTGKIVTKLIKSLIKPIGKANAIRHDLTGRK